MEKYELKSMLKLLYDSAKKYVAISVIAVTGCANNAALNQEEMPAYQNSFTQPGVQKKIDKVAESIADMPLSNYKQLYEAQMFVIENADADKDNKVTQKELSDFLKKNPWIPYKGE